MSWQTMEVINRLVTSSSAISDDFLQLYIAHSIDCCDKNKDKYAKARLARLLCVLVQSLLRLRPDVVVGMSAELQVRFKTSAQYALHCCATHTILQTFCIQFSKIKEAAALFRSLKQLEEPSVYTATAASSDSPKSPSRVPQK